jgi:hypothetical protein
MVVGPCCLEKTCLLRSNGCLDSLVICMADEQLLDIQCQFSTCIMAMKHQFTMTRTKIASNSFATAERTQALSTPWPQLPAWVQLYFSTESSYSQPPVNALCCCCCCCGCRDLGGKLRFSGQVATVKCFENNPLVRKAFEEPGNGRVLVVDGGGSLRCALLGDNIAEMAHKNGWSVSGNGALGLQGMWWAAAGRSGGLWSSWSNVAACCLQCAISHAA